MNRRIAQQFLEHSRKPGVQNRVPRKNTGFFEEIKSNSFERECKEEVCTYSAFENFGPAPKFGHFIGFWRKISLQKPQNDQIEEVAPKFLNALYEEMKECFPEEKQRAQETWNEYNDHCYRS